MLIAKTNPQGLDIPIQQLQAYLHGELLTTWGINTAQYRCYSRCYRNRRNGVYMAENFEGNNEYKDAYWDDSLSAVSFFGLSGIENHNISEKVNVHLVFFCNLAKLKPAITHRADEEVRKDVQLLVADGIFSFRYLSTEMWASNCLKEYQGSAAKLESAVDMHPVHCFRINFELNYNKNICS